MSPEKQALLKTDLDAIALFIGQLRFEKPSVSNSDSC